MAMAPSSLQEANRLAVLEWFRTKAADMGDDEGEFRAVSGGADDPELDAALARMLLARRPGLRLTVVSSNEEYASLPTKHKDLVGVVEVVAGNILTWEGGGGFDLAVIASWGSLAGRSDPKEEASQCAVALSRLCRPGGTAAVIRPGKTGVYHLRARLHAQLMRRPGQDPLDIDALEPGGSTLATALAGSGFCEWVERIDSQVDVSAAVGEELTTAGERLLRQLLAVDIQQLAREHPALTEQLIDELCDMTLAGDGFTGPAVVYCPLHAVIATRGKGGGKAKGGVRKGEAASASATSLSTASSASSASSSSSSSSATQRHSGIEDAPRGGVAERPRVLDGAAQVVERRALPAGHTKSLLPADPSRLVESESEARRAAAALVESSVASSVAGVSSSSSSDPLFFYLRMRGDWGNFVGTGAGDVVRCGKDYADDAYEHGGGATTRAPKGVGGSGTDRVRAMLYTPHDPWFPHGLGGGFFNVGLRNWNEMRMSWVARPPGFVEPAYPAELDSEELIEELSKLQRTYTLPGPVRLPDLIDLYQDIWEEELAPRRF